MFLSNASYPPDLRLQKEGTTLLKLGHKITILCNKTGKQKTSEIINGFLVIRIHHILIKIPKAGRFIHYLFDKYKFLFKTLLISKKSKIDVIHVHDLPLALPALLTSKILQIPIILDFHENYIQMFRSNHETTFITRILCRLFKFEESISSKIADKIIVVTKEAKKRLIQEYNLDSKKISIISNTADIEELSQISKHTPKKLDGYSILYVGSFSKHRGLDTLIKATSMLSAKSNIKVYLVGGVNNPEKRRLQKLIEDLDLERKIRIINELDPIETSKYMMGANVCVVPHLSNPHTEATIPHKLFNYMYFMKPVLVSDIHPLKKIIEECKCGKVFKAGDADSLKKQLLYFEKNRDKLVKMGKNAYHSIINKYNWNQEEIKLEKMYSMIDDIRK